MIVIADSSPLIVIHKIQLIEVLPKLFGSIIIPPAVFGELQNIQRDPTATAFFAGRPTWLVVKTPSHSAVVAGLHSGESEALTLAADLRADFLLVDDRKAFREAIARKLNAIGTIRVLEMAADQNLLDLRAAFDRIKQTNFWIDHRLLDARLKLRQNGSNPPIS